uniref:Cysteine proteinase inhibitor n=1 Tax=Wollemia nobilis TaxID=56998 RepID=A0A0C9RYG9_9CONI
MQPKFVVGVILFVIANFGFFISKTEAEAMAFVGGKKDVQGFENSIDIEEVGRFAVHEHNKQQNNDLSFSRVVKAQEQVVAGTMYHLTVETQAKEGNDQPQLYEAKVWVKPWENFKKLEGFKPVEVDQPSATSITSADLGVKKEHLRGSGWREVPVHDPVIQEAAEHAVKNIQQRSNSLAAYVLQEILLSKAEIVDDLAKFDLLLKTKKGAKEEQHKVEMHRSLDGKWLMKSHSTC